MRDRVAAYLERAGSPLPAEKILRDVLNIHSPNALSADRVLRGILGGDSRFHRHEGLWSVARAEGPPLADTAALALQWTDGRPRWYRGAVFIPAEDVSIEWFCTDTPPSDQLTRLGDARARADGRLLLAWSARELRAWNRLLRSARLPAWDGESLFLGGFAARVLPRGPRLRQPEDLAAAAALPSPDPDRQGSVACLLEAAFRTLLQEVPAGRRESAAELNRWIAATEPKMDFSRFAFGRDYLRTLPDVPGTYVMRNRAGEVIYVGKAGNLRRRVQSYFSPRALEDARVARIHHQLYSLEVLTCATEADALILEMRMIRDFSPAINLQSEVHERPGRYGTGGNLVLLVPVGEKAVLYYLKEGAFAARQTVRLGTPSSKAVLAKIRNTYFRTRRRRTIPVEAWETELVARWLSARRKQLNLIDVDEAGALDGVIRRLDRYLMDPDHLAHKVYYR
jgi:hypothetical protein